MEATDSPNYRGAAWPVVIGTTRVTIFCMYLYELSRVTKHEKRCIYTDGSVVPIG